MARLEVEHGDVFVMEDDECIYAASAPEQLPIAVAIVDLLNRGWIDKGLALAGAQTPTEVIRNG